MSKQLTKTSKAWCKSIGINPTDILDPDGWDRANFDNSFNREVITRQEFRRRLINSTVNVTDAIYQECV